MTLKRPKSVTDAMSGIYPSSGDHVKRLKTSNKNIHSKYVLEVQSIAS